MAQIIKLKRTAVQGKIPTTSNLDLGELAINTYDGRIFFQKDVDGILSIQEILTTDSQTSGSFNLTGAISASSLNISGDTTIDGNLVLGGNITIGDSDTDTIVVAADFSGSITPDGNELYDLGSSIKKWNNVYVKNVRGTDVYGSTSVQAPTGSFDVIDLDRLALTSTQTTVSPLHLTATTLNDGVGALRIDGAQADIYLNPTASTHTTVTFAVDGSPKLAFGMDSSDDFYITRNNGTSWYDDTFVLDRNTGEVTLGYDLTVNGNINATNGIISGSSQITDLTTHKETVSGASSYAIDHNLNEQYPIVQCWNTATSQQEIANTITTNSVNRVTVVFSTTFAGKIIVKK